MRNVLGLIGVLAGLAILPGTPAGAAQIDFATALPLGNLGASTTIGGVTLSAWSVSKSNLASWTTTTLNNRNEQPDDFGLGVCPVTGSCPTTGNGNINEIDNNGSRFDVLRIQVAAGYTLSQIALGSLDGGTTDNFAIFGASTANPIFSSLTLLAQGSNATVGTTTPLIPVGSGYTYYYVSDQKRGCQDTGSNFLVSSLAMSQVPEPYSNALVSCGLLVIVLRLNLRRRVR